MIENYEAMKKIYKGERENHFHNKWHVTLEWLKL
jgi:hypothetical protein